MEQVPVLVCLTFADKLYAEHMSDEGKDPDKTFMKCEVAHQLKVSHVCQTSTANKYLPLVHMPHGCSSHSKCQ